MTHSHPAPNLTRTIWASPPWARRLGVRGLLAFLVAAGAARESMAAPPEESGTSAEQRVKAIITSELPSNALEVEKAMPAAVAAKASGMTITLRGNVARSLDALVENRAIFTLVDESTNKGCCPAGDALPETACSIPPEGKATIQILDGRGRPLRIGLNGRHGLRPGAEVFVTGSIASANGRDALVVTATSIHVPEGPLPPGVFTEARIDGARDLSEVRRSASLSVGDAVTFRGRVGGSSQPFASDRAELSLVGAGISPCDQSTKEPCRTPWDFCGRERQEVLAHSVKVQLVDASGRPLRTTMKGRRGLKELSELEVSGVVAQIGAEGMVITATRLRVLP